MVESFLTSLTKQRDSITGFLTKEKARGIRLNIINCFLERNCYELTWSP